MCIRDRNQPSLEKFESTLNTGGVLIYDGYGIINPPTRKDSHVYRINARDAANEMNNAKAFNMIVLGGLRSEEHTSELQSQR